MPKAKPETNADEQDDTDALLACATELLDIEDDHVATAARMIAEAERAEYLASLPHKIKMLRTHGFIDENGMQRQWVAGFVISNHEEIILLSDRKAVFEVV